MGKLEGKVAVITSGNSSVGLATAKRFITEGADVFITGRRRVELDAAVKELGEHATGVQGDVSKPADLDRLYATVKVRKGHIDILFTNVDDAEMVSLGEISEEHFDRIFDTEVKGVLFTVEKALSLMPEGGSIILNVSIVASIETPAHSAYSAYKDAVRLLVRNWTLALKERRIHVNVISPRPTATPGLDGMAQGKYSEYLKNGVVAGTSLGRLGAPDEITSGVVFLASDDSSFVTGAEFFVDGGIAQV